jgi:hypothetical protein
MLQPVIRMIVNPDRTAGSITGTVQPDSVGAFIYAIQGPDTVQTARAAQRTVHLGSLPVGTYTVAIHPDTAYRDTTRTSVGVTAAHTTNSGTSCSPTSQRKLRSWPCADVTNVFRSIHECGSGVFPPRAAFECLKILRDSREPGLS